MEKEKKLKLLYMSTAENFSQMSCCSRLKVGAILVKNGSILAHAWNGTPSGYKTNICEEREILYPTGFLDPQEYIDMGYQPLETELGWFRYKTHSFVLHAEQNLLIKMAKSTESIFGSDIYCTHSPCSECSKMLAQSGINAFYYRNEYRDTSGIEVLKSLGVKVEKL